MFKKKGNKKLRKGKRSVGRRKLRISSNPMSRIKNYATITETIKPQIRGTNTTALQANTVYTSVISIAGFPRAKALAACFKFYRLKAVVYEYVPDAINYQAGVNATTETVPYMYYMMNRDGSDAAAAAGLVSFQNCGARPIKFTKTIRIAYKPNLIKANQLIVTLVPSTSLYNGNNTAVYDQWISTMGLQHPGTPSWAGDQSSLPEYAEGAVTNPLTPPDQINVLPYYGHTFIFDQQVSPAGATSVGYVSQTCIWEFKEPVLYGAGSGLQQTPPVNL